MPIVSKYSTAQIENLVNQLLEQLHANQATTELGLMCLGNAVSHIINSSVPESQRQTVATHFSQALADSITSKKN
ncbi:DUF1414 domain-containing protein [Chromatiaceae bacterium AAb-1]|jgi:uncharacterized protein YejL (UPF0352 family)|nr:DUF1414 domain-containing protein [Chromatiaceae bacterium AAb-1]